MTLLEAIDTYYEGELTLDNVYSLALVSNTLDHDPAVVRGIAIEHIPTKVVRASFFSDIDSKIREYENLADYQIQENLAPATALRQFVQPLPERLVFITTNAQSWLIPMLSALDKEFQLFKGRKYEVVDLGRIATVKESVQLRRGGSWDSVLPPSRFNSRTGSLTNLADMVGVRRATFVSEPVFPRARAMMLAESFRRFLDKMLIEKD